MNFSLTTQDFVAILNDPDGWVMAKDVLSRRLAVIIAADMVGYSRLVAMPKTICCSAPAEALRTAA